MGRRCKTFCHAKISVGSSVNDLQSRSGDGFGKQQFDGEDRFCVFCEPAFQPVMDRSVCILLLHESISRRQPGHE